MKCRNSTSERPPTAVSRFLSLPRKKGGTPTFLPRSSQRGVALVLTLIMLAIITVVTVAFLASSRRARQTTQVQLELSNAERGSEIAYQRALSEIMTNILGARANNTNAPNLLAMDFFVSRRGGPAGMANATNVLRTIGNYLDLNRNGRFDDPDAYTNYPYGDPAWIAVHDKPWMGSGANNQDLIRIAYVVQPVGKSLDLNTIHNAASPSNGEQFLRNQGVGPWELNLAAFFAELNPDVWYKTPGSGQLQYNYGPFPTPIAGGDAFSDAKFITDYRRGWDPDPLNPNPQDIVSAPFAVFYPQAVSAPVIKFPPASIDLYADGNNGAVLGANLFAPGDDANITKLSNKHWFGSDPSNHWFHPQEFFDDVTYKTTNIFLTNFLRAINGWTPDSIAGDPVSFYRMFAQLGTDTGSDFHDRINLNFVDEHATWTNLTVADFVSWTNSDALAVTFFTNVAERIFLAQSNEFNPFPGTNALPIRSMMAIPIFPTNQYSTAIHRILQEAANIFDATTTNIYPSVFRPVFGTKGAGDSTLYIVDYIRDDRVSTLQAWLDANTNGIPLVVGAKKGFPNFNEFTVRSDITMTRKLQVTRTSSDPGTKPSGTNQMYILGISNAFGAEGWNSYYDDYVRPVTLTVSNFATVWLSNSLGFQAKSNLEAIAVRNLGSKEWRGAGDIRQGTAISNNFIMALDTNQVFLSNSVYIFNGPNQNTFANVSTNAFEIDSTFPLPYWVFTISNRLSYLMSENAGGYERIVDFVLLNDNHVVDVFRDLLSAQDPYDRTGAGPGITGIWDTNRSSAATGPTRGVVRQIDISLGNIPTANAEWRSYALAQTATENDKNAAIDAFRVFNGLSPMYSATAWTNPALAMETPFNPSAKLSAVTTWQANDPLVHYHAQDLRMGAATNHQYLRPDQSSTNISPSSLGRINDRYSPWGGKFSSSAEDASFYDRKIKDAGIYSSDDWNFPTNKLASVGLLGRVHRGTPWQTIYLKAEAAPVSGNIVGWTNVSADIAVHPKGGQFSRTHPTNDWRLMDMFSTAIDERTSRGLVSINQTNLETWSALLSGVVVLSNSLDSPIIAEPRQYAEMFIEPWGKRPFAQSPMAQLWSNIHWFQTNYARPLESVGDLLQLPILTVDSPFLNLRGGEQDKWGVDDYAYEQIPAQVLSLLRVGESRFVIYAYGQALKPTDIDPSTGQVRNYQITAEHATRTVVRIEGDPRTRVRAVVESFNILPPD